MWREFKAFLVKQNVIALAIAVVIGAATAELVQALVNAFIMPLVGAVLPAGDWLNWRVPRSGPVQFHVGVFLSALLNFVIVLFVAWQIARAVIRPTPDAKPATRPCPYCKQSIDAAATRCSFCTSQLTATA
jgi:large conductance mechanosensitive channel